MGTFTKIIDRWFPPASQIPELNGISLDEEPDVRGFDMGYVLDKPHRQGTVNFGLPDDTGRVTDSAWRSWENAIATTKQMVATATIDEVGNTAQPARVATTFRAVGKDQTKDMTALVTDVSLRQSDLYDQAEALGLSARPLDSAAIAHAVHYGLTGTSGRWDDIDEVHISDRGDHLVVDQSRYTTAFTVNTAIPQVADILDSIMDNWEGEDVLRRTRFFRPYVLPEGTGDDLATGHGRRWALVTITGNADADLGFRQAIDLNPAIGLHVRRLHGRQRTAALAGLGLGVFGWQHIGNAQRSTRKDNK